jgi:hypothetical protein
MDTTTLAWVVMGKAARLWSPKKTIPIFLRIIYRTA